MPLSSRSITSWFSRMDARLFSPPHQFETILAFVGLRLGLLEGGEREDLSTGLKSSLGAAGQARSGTYGGDSRN
jgi:hypothetical protein